MGVLRANTGALWRNIGCGGSAGGAPITDDFNRADSTTTLGSPWGVGQDSAPTRVPLFGITSNTAYMVREDTPGSFGIPMAYVDNGHADIDMSVTVSTMPTASNPGLFFRSSSGMTGHWIVSRAGLTDPSGTTRATWTGAVSGDVLRVTAIGSVITVYVNGTQVGTYTSSTSATNTRHGLYVPVPGAAIRYDDFTLTDPTATSGRLKLWDGTRWVREVCNGDVADSNGYPTATNTVTIYADNAGTMYGYTNRLTGSGIAHLDMNIDSAQHTFVYQSGDVNGGHAIFTCSIAGSWIGTAVSNAYWRTSSESFIGFGNWNPSTVLAYSTPPERHPLKMWDGTTWQTVACLTPA